MEIITKSPEETQNLGKKIAANVSHGVYALSGQLGSGKTTFVQGFADGLGVTQRIISPTFILLRSYDVKSDSDVKGENIKHFYHVDLYRLDDNLEEEIKNLGLPQIWSDKNSVVLIEWAEKIKNLLPQKTIWINFEYAPQDSRKIILEI